jgi:threonine/homoserine/homoserine lactone efflux protein
MLDLWLRGFAIGLAIAAPVGPIGVLCMRRTLLSGSLAGFVTGLGAAAADATYGALGAFGTALAAALVGQQAWIATVGGLFLIWLGVAAMRRPPAELEAAAAPRASHLAGYFGTTFLLTLANPATILSFAAIFAGLGLGAGETPAAAAGLRLVGGVFLGSAAWWLFLSGIVGLVRHRLGRGALLWINRLSGLVLLGFGIAAIWLAWR